VRLISDEQCRGNVAILVGSRRLTRVRGRSFEARATKVAMKLSKRAARRLRRAKRLSLRASCTDAAGNKGTARRTVKLKR
jgi:hypothetical protein